MRLWPRKWSLFAGCAVALALALPAAAEPVRYHGIALDEKYMLMLEQRDGRITVFLSMRSRQVGGGAIVGTTLEAGTDEVSRFKDKKLLVYVQCEVLKPSAPNYLSNPGERYRIIVRGADVLPDYVAIHEVRDIEARDTLIQEFEKIGSKLNGIEREAMHFAGPMVLGVLNDYKKLPADVPVSIERSGVGKIRGLGKSLQRETLPAGQKLNPAAGPSPTSERQSEASGTDAPTG